MKLLYLIISFDNKVLTMPNRLDARQEIRQLPVSPLGKNSKVTSSSLEVSNSICQL